MNSFFTTTIRSLTRSISLMALVALISAGDTRHAAAAPPLPVGSPYSPEYIEAYYSQPEAFFSTGGVTSSMIGNGVWWRPELDETSITLMLHNLSEWGFENVYVDVFRSGQTLFPSKVFPQQPGATDRDWLDFIITEAHNHNIRVHAWIQTLCWHEPDANVGSTHPLLLKNPHWQQTTADGQFADGTTAARYVSPAYPEVRTALITMVDELCHYPLDGVNLDAVQYNYRLEADYSSFSVKEFQARHDIDPTELRRTRSEDSDWMKWVAHREDHLTSLVQMLSDECRLSGISNKRRIVVSADVHPAYEESRGLNRRYQHWGQWVAEGIIDATIPQCFAADVPGLERQLWEARSVHMGSTVACVPGLQLHPTTTGHRLTLAAQRQVLGNAGFQYCTIMDYQALLQEKTESQADTETEPDTGGFWGFFTGD